MAGQEDHNKTIAAWMRAVEALLMSMPGLTPECIKAAHDLLDENYKWKYKNTWEATARLRPGEPLDEDAGAVLKRIEAGVAKRDGDA